MLTARRFRDMWQVLHCQGDWEPEWERRVASYSEPWRRYHTMAHIEHMFRELDTVYDELERPYEAYWKALDHDVAYDTMRNGKPVTDNEERSAAYNADTLYRAGVSHPIITRIGMGIMATKSHVADDLSHDDKLIVSTDLAILGAPWIAYKAYTVGVENEWRYNGQLSARQFVEGRISLFLEPFLKRPGHIFPVEPFTSRYQDRARVNLEWELRYQLDRLEALSA